MIIANSTPVEATCSVQNSIRQMTYLFPFFHPFGCWCLIPAQRDLSLLLTSASFRKASFIAYDFWCFLFFCCHEADQPEDSFWPRSHTARYKLMTRFFWQGRLKAPLVTKAPYFLSMIGTGNVIGLQSRPLFFLFLLDLCSLILATDVT